MESKDEVTEISKAQSLDEMVEFWETHSTFDFHDQTQEVAIEFDSSTQLNRIAIEPLLMQDLWGIAEQKRVSVETLINVWLRQNVDKVQSQYLPRVESVLAT